MERKGRDSPVGVEKARGAAGSQRLGGRRGTLRRHAPGRRGKRGGMGSRPADPAGYEPCPPVESSQSEPGNGTRAWREPALPASSTAQPASPDPAGRAAARRFRGTQVANGEAPSAAPRLLLPSATSSTGARGRVTPHPLGPRAQDLRGRHLAAREPTEEEEEGSGRSTHL